MARVTVEDCVTKIPNRFELVMLASQRARDISAGAEPTVDEDDDKMPVIALREIAGGTAARDALAESLVCSLQRLVEIDEPDDTPLSLPAAEDAEGEGGGADAPATDPSEAAAKGSDGASDTAAAAETSTGDAGAPAPAPGSNVIDFAPAAAAIRARPTADAPATPADDDTGR